MKEKSAAVVKFGGEESFSLVPKTLEEAMKFSDIISKTDMIPQDYKNKPGNILVAMQMGMEVGLPPLQALQGIAVINGRPSIWGDCAIALVKVHPECEYIHEYYLNKKGERTTGDDYHIAACAVKRKGQGEETRTFSLDEAKKARLVGKAGTWSTYQKRMLGMRARGFALRDVFPDALKGLSIVEEVRDYNPKDITPVNETTVIESPISMEDALETPSIDTEADVIVTKKEKEGAVEGEIVDEEVPGDELDETVTGMIDRIEMIGNKFEGENWLTKHSSDIDKLPEDAKEVVMDNYKGKMAALAKAGDAKEETAKGDEDSLVLDYIKKLEKSKDLDELDAVFDEAQNKIKTGAKVVALRKVRDKRAQEIKGNK